MAEYQGPRYTQGPNVYGDLQNYRFAMGGTETKYTQGPRVQTGAAHTSRGSGPAPTVGGYRTPGSPRVSSFTPAASGLGSPDYSQQMNVAERGGQIGQKNRGGGGGQRGGGGGGFNISVGDVAIGSQFQKNVQAQGNVNQTNTGTFQTSDSFNYARMMKQPTSGGGQPPANPPVAAGGVTPPAGPPAGPAGRPMVPFPNQPPVSKPTPPTYKGPIGPQFQPTQPAGPAGPAALGAGQPTNTPAAPMGTIGAGPQPAGIGAGAKSAQDKAMDRYNQGQMGATQPEYDAWGQKAGVYGPWPSQAQGQPQQPTGPLAISGPQAPAGLPAAPAQEPENPSAKKPSTKKPASKSSKPASSKPKLKQGNYTKTGMQAKKLTKVTKTSKTTKNAPSKDEEE